MARIALMGRNFPPFGDYGELERQTEDTVREWLGVADRIADYLEVHGSLDARKINEVYAYR